MTLEKRSFTRAFTRFRAWLDSWGPRLSNISQVLLCIAAFWGLFYYIIPLARLTATDNELARKTIELEKTNTALSQTYQRFRSLFIGEVLQNLLSNCTGASTYNSGNADSLPNGDWRSIFKMDPVKCVVNPPPNPQSSFPILLPYKDFSTILKPDDRFALEKRLVAAEGIIRKLQAEYLAKYDAVNTAQVKSLPTLSDQRVELMRIASWPPTEDARRNQARWEIVGEYVGEATTRAMNAAGDPLNPGIRFDPSGP